MSIKFLQNPCPRITDQNASIWLLEWTPERDLPKDTVVELRGQNLRTLLRVDWDQIEIENDLWTTEWRVPQNCDFCNIDANNPTLVRFRALKPIAGKTPQRILIKARLHTIPDSDFLFRILINEDETAVNDSFSLTTRPGAPRTLRLYARPTLLNDGSLRAVLTPEDVDSCPTRFLRPLRVSLYRDNERLWAGHVQAPTVVIMPNISEDCSLPLRLKAEVACHELSSEEEISNGRHENGKVCITSNPFFPNPLDRIPAFGAIHWHTRISPDGQRSPDTGFLVARDAINLDFATPADHTPHDSDWEELVNSMDFFNEDGNFNTLYGWELSSDRGHINFYFTDPDHPLNPNSFPGNTRPEKYIESIPHRHFIAIPHHTNAVSNELRADGQHFWREYPWGTPCPEYLRQVEIFQSRGNQEREQYPEGWRQQHENNGGSVQSGLDKGHPLGFVGGTDNHVCFPTVNTKKLGRIVTGAWLEDRTREDLFNALYQRHTWACWDTRAIVRFEINGALQGSDLSVTSETPLKARVRASFEAPLDLLELVWNNDTSMALPFDVNALDIDTEIDLGLVNQRTYIYLRARQIDGALVYASPVFLTED